MSQFIIERALAPAQGEVAQLFIAFAEPEQIREQKDVLIASLAQTFPAAAIVIVQPRAQESSAHLAQRVLQQEILNDEELLAYVQSAQAECQELIRAQQERFKVAPEATALIALGQVASVILELTKLASVMAGRVFAFGARYAQLPTENLSLDQTVHFLHGAKDPIVPVLHTGQAQERFAQLDGDATIDVGHAMENSFNPELIQKMLERLLTCVPLRYWRDAQGNAQESCGPGPEDSVH